MTNFEFCRGSIHSKTTESCLLLFLCTLDYTLEPTERPSRPIHLNVYIEFDPGMVRKGALKCYMTSLCKWSVVLTVPKPYHQSTLAANSLFPPQGITVGLKRKFETWRAIFKRFFFCLKACQKYVLPYFWKSCITVKVPKKEKLAKNAPNSIAF